MTEDWFYMTPYGNNGDGEKAAQRSGLDNLTQLIITQSKGFTKKSIGKVIRSVREYVCFVFILRLKHD